ncbi:DUF6597 domain-containing transcriptional factor [Kribbella sp. NPDC055071]
MSEEQTYREARPLPVLRSVVSSVWIQEIGRDSSPYLHRQIPNGAVELTCRLGDTPRLQGPRTEALAEVLEPGTTVVGVRFVPGAFPAVSDVPASELTGLTVDASDLWGNALADAVGTATSASAALIAVQRHVRTWMTAPPDPLISAGVRGLMPWQAADVASLTAALHISESQFRRRCHAAVGLAPKDLHRILRFQGFLALVQYSIAQHHPTSLGRLAVRAGYADQSHLNRECLRLTGVSPGTFCAETHQTCADNHDHSASFAPVLQLTT